MAGLPGKPCERASPLQRSRNAEKVSKMSPGASGPRTPKSLQKVSGTVQKDSFDISEDFPDCSRDFLETFRGSGAGGPGRHFRDSFGISGPKGPRDLCKGRAGLPGKPPPEKCQGELKGQTKRDKRSQIRSFFRRFSLIFADFRFSWELQHFGGRKPQETADFRRKPQQTVDFRRNPPVCPFSLFVPFNSALKWESSMAPPEEPPQSRLRDPLQQPLREHLSGLRPSD